MDSNVSDDLISVIELSKEVGKQKQTVFRLIKQLGIETKKLRAEDSHGQLISYVDREDAKQLKDRLKAEIDKEIDGVTNNDFGLFYLIQLEPEYDPGRIKLGFATNLNERLRSHRCSAPFAKVIGTWSCKLLWEKTAIESVTVNCEKLHTEVFRSVSINDVKDRCHRFFAVMPNLDKEET